MASIGDFVGTYTIRNVATEDPDPLLQVNGQLSIGTGFQNATTPSLTDGYFVVAGFSILDPGGKVLLSSQDEKGTPLQLALVDSNLRWAGYYQGRPLRIYISRYEITSLGGVVTRGIYGTNVWGDPDQVGVWGADDTAAPPPPSPVAL